MVVGAFPVAKLASLFIKQISKPIANMAKERAKSHPFFRTYICMPPAQFYNWCEIKAKMWILNMGKPVNVPVLSEAMAIDLGANLLGEGIIFIIAAGVLLAEYSRQVRKEAAKEQARLDELAQIHSNMNNLQNIIQEQQMQIKHISNALSTLEFVTGKKPIISHIKKGSSEYPPSPSASRKSYDKISNTPSQAQPVDHESGRQSSVVSNALLYLENDIFHTPERPRNVGLITKGLDYLYCNSFIVTSIS